MCCLFYLLDLDSSDLWPLPGFLAALQCMLNSVHNIIWAGLESSGLRGQSTLMLANELFGTKLRQLAYWVF